MSDEVSNLIQIVNMQTLSKLSKYLHETMYYVCVFTILATTQFVHIVTMKKNPSLSAMSVVIEFTQSLQMANMQTLSKYWYQTIYYVCVYLGMYV